MQLAQRMPTSSAALALQGALPGALALQQWLNASSVRSVLPNCRATLTLAEPSPSQVGLLAAADVGKAAGTEAEHIEKVPEGPAVMFGCALFTSCPLVLLAGNTSCENA